MSRPKTFNNGKFYALMGNHQVRKIPGQHADHEDALAAAVGMRSAYAVLWVFSHKQARTIGNALVRLTRES